MELDGRNTLADVERGRTLLRWLPRRLGVPKEGLRVVLAKKLASKRSPAEIVFWFLVMTSFEFGPDWLRYKNMFESSLYVKVD